MREVLLVLALLLGSGLVGSHKSRACSPLDSEIAQASFPSGRAPRDTLVWVGTMPNGEFSARDNSTVVLRQGTAIGPAVATRRIEQGQPGVLLPAILVPLGLLMPDTTYVTVDDAFVVWSSFTTTSEQSVAPTEVRARLDVRVGRFQPWCPDPGSYAVTIENAGLAFLDATRAPGTTFSVTDAGSLPLMVGAVPGSLGGWGTGFEGSAVVCNLAGNCLVGERLEVASCGCTTGGPVPWVGLLALWWAGRRREQVRTTPGEL